MMNMQRKQTTQPGLAAFSEGNKYATLSCRNNNSMYEGLEPQENYRHYDFLYQCRCHKPSENTYELKYHGV